MTWTSPIAAATDLVYELEHARGIVDDVTRELPRVHSLAESRGTALRVELRRAVHRSVARRVAAGMRGDLLLLRVPEPYRLHVLVAKIAEAWPLSEEALHG